MSLNSLMASFRDYAGNFTRRDLFRGGSWLALPALVGKRGSATPAPPASEGLRIGPDIYQSIGVRPFISGTGTLTVNGGTLELPEVRAAMDAAARHMVQLDELMDAVGKRLAELTGAEWGMVTAGCAAAMTHATTACVAGGNPDKHIRLPNTQGLGKDEVIIPKHSRNNYDAAIRAVGVRIIEVENAAELEAAIGPRTAMIYIFAGPRADAGPPSYAEITRIAREKNVPVLTDAAAEVLTIPNIHLQQGATLVAYSGGKQLRGPQCSGILLGRKDLIRAAWVHSAPHHGFSRITKVGKEEIIGALAAVEAWVKRDQKAYWQDMVDRLNTIGKRVATVSGVTFTVREPGAALSNRSAGLTVRWEAEKLGITGEEVSHILNTTDPRILVGGGRGAQNGISVTGFNLAPGEEKVVAERLYAVLSAKHTLKVTEAPKPPAADLSGVWDVHIEFAASTGEHSLSLQQQGARVQGVHHGEFVSRDLNGSVNGDTVLLRSNLAEREIGNALSFTFSGKITGDTLEGDLDMGEYLKAKWSAKRHRFTSGERGQG
ncbi:MAG TPA: aminotransferase class V-fold PLP-dependent enzyme [Bryobacteraceae bacterium]|jgi:L-seryl-tRNA(Ser) seleniumtransferase